MNSVDETLAVRGARYGEFVKVAELSQALKNVIKQSCDWDRLPFVNREAIETILEKIARSVCGDPWYADNWHDIGGYAKLVENEINKVHAVQR